MEISAGVINVVFWKVKTSTSDDGSGWGWHMMNPLLQSLELCVFSGWGGVHFTLKGPSHSEEWEYVLCIFIHTLDGHC